MREENLEMLCNLASEETNNNDLVDIKRINLIDNEDIKTKITSFFNQIKNPYLFKVGKIKVQVSFNNKNDRTLDNILVEHFSNLKEA